jgi:hypothetical protein
MKYLILTLPLRYDLLVHPKQVSKRHQAAKLDGLQENSAFWHITPYKSRMSPRQTSLVRPDLPRYGIVKHVFAECVMGQIYDDIPCGLSFGPQFAKKPRPCWLEQFA